MGLFTNGVLKTNACLTVFKELGTDLSNFERDLLITQTTKETQSVEEFLQESLLPEIRKYRSEEEALELIDTCKIALSNLTKGFKEE